MSAPKHRARGRWAVLVARLDLGPARDTCPGCQAARDGQAPQPHNCWQPKPWPSEPGPYDE